MRSVPGPDSDGFRCGEPKSLDLHSRFPEAMLVMHSPPGGEPATEINEQGTGQLRFEGSVEPLHLIHSPSKKSIGLTGRSSDGRKGSFTAENGALGVGQIQLSRPTCRNAHLLQDSVPFSRDSVSRSASEIRASAKRVGGLSTASQEGGRALAMGDGSVPSPLIPIGCHQPPAPLRVIPVALANIPLDYTDRSV